MACSKISSPATLRKFCRSTAGFLAIRRWWRCSQLWRLACPAGGHRRYFLKASGTLLSISSPSTNSTTQPKQLGRYTAAHLSCRTSTMTKSWKRRNPFSAREVSVRTSPFYPVNHFALGPPLVAAHATPTLASSTSLSLVSTRVSSNRYSFLVFGVVNNLMREMICTLKKSTTQTGSQPRRTDTVTRLLQERLDAKYAQEFHGDIAQSKKRWPKGIAVGRLSVG